MAAQDLLCWVDGRKASSIVRCLNSNPGVRAFEHQLHKRIWARDLRIAGQAVEKRVLSGEPRAPIGIAHERVGMSSRRYRFLIDCVQQRDGPLRPKNSQLLPFLYFCGIVNENAC